MTIARYDAIAEFYVERARGIADEPVGRSVLELLADVTGLRILDLACCHGRASLELARRGARVTGLDISAELLVRGEAAAAAEGLRIDWRRGDASAPDALAGEVFDGVVSHFGLADIDDLEGALGTVSRVLRPGGVLVFSILHPCFPGWGDDAPSSWQPGTGYYREGWWLAANTGFRGHVGSTHRTLASYFNALVDHRLRPERVVEPEPTGAWLDRNPSHDLVPTFLVVRCTST